jgi:hypothetical protein
MQDRRTPRTSQPRKGHSMRVPDEATMRATRPSNRSGCERSGTRPNEPRGRAGRTGVWSAPEHDSIQIASGEWRCFVDDVGQGYRWRLAGQKQCPESGPATPDPKWLFVAPCMRLACVTGCMSGNCPGRQTLSCLRAGWLSRSADASGISTLDACMREFLLRARIIGFRSLLAISTVIGKTWLHSAVRDGRFVWSGNAASTGIA